MVNQQLLDYIKQQLQQGIPSEEVKRALLSAGWPAADVATVFPATAPLTPPSPTPATIVPPTTPLGSANYAPATNPVQLWTPGKTPAKGKKIAILAGLAGGILLLAGGGVWAYFNYFQPPEKILDKMIDNWSQVKTFDANSKLVLEDLTTSLPVSQLSPFSQSGASKQKGSVTIETNGVSDITDINKLKTAFSFNANAKDVGGLDGSMALGVEAKIINKVYYFKITEVPAILGLFGVDFFKNQWFKFDLEALASQFGAEGKQAAEEVNNVNLTPEDINQIRTLIKTSRPVNFAAKLPSEDINGLATYHYKLEVNKDGLVNMFTALTDIILKKTGQKQIDPKEKQGMIDEIKSIKNWPEIEVWIGKKELLPYKFLITGNIPKSDSAEIAGKYTLTLTFKNFNQPVKIDAPADAKDILAMLGDSRTKSRDAKRISDVKQIQTALEMYYGEKTAYPISAEPIILGTGKYQALGRNGWSDQTVGLSVGDTGIYMGVVPKDPGNNGWNYVYCSTTLKEPNKCANSGESYILNFQLENNSGGFLAGQHTATPNGIGSAMVTVPPELYPDTQPQTLNPETNSRPNSGFYPLVGAKQRDDRRVSDIKQIQTALEMYFNEKGNAYPVAKNLILGEGMAKALNETGFSSSTNGKIIIMSMVPANPTPGGSSYVYNSSSDATNYSITFTLEQGVGTLKAGPHTADANGMR